MAAPRLAGVSTADRNNLPSLVFLRRSLGGRQAPESAAFFVVCLLSASVMDIALRAGDGAVAQLAAGVADKLRDAVAKYGDLLTPTSTDGRAVLGQEFRMLADHASLQAVEMGVLNNWLELAYSAEVAARFQLDVPTFNVANVPLQLVPPPVAMPQLLGPGIPATPAGAATFNQMSQGMFGAPPQQQPLVAPMASLTTATSARSPHQAADEAAHGMEAGEIALLTWLLHTARQPPPGHDSVKYGVDPPTVTKLYREYRGSGTILWDMIKDEKTTLRDMQGHFHRAIQSAEGSPRIVQRLADHWMEMQQHFDSVELMRSYHSRFLIMRAGRGLPKLVDEHIVMLVMVDELGRVRRGAGGTGAAESAAVMEKAMSSVESIKATVTELKSKVSDLKQEVNNMKNEVSNLKKEKPPKEKVDLKDRECNYCGTRGHTEAFCHKRIGDEAVKAAKKAAEQ